MQASVEKGMCWNEDEEDIVIIACRARARHICLKGLLSYHKSLGFYTTIPNGCMGGKSYCTKVTNGLAMVVVCFRIVLSESDTTDLKV